MEKNVRIDPLTNETFIPRRSNQIYATRKNQTAYNNLKAAGIRLEKSPVQKSLNKNHAILKKLIGNSKEIILSKDYLLGAGFNFSCITNLGSAVDKSYVYMFFNFKIIITPDQKYKISKND